MYALLGTASSILVSRGEFPAINKIGTCSACVWLLFLLMPTLRGSHSDFSNMVVCGVLHSGSTLGMVRTG